MSLDAQAISTALEASLRALDRVAEEDRPAFEAALRAQFDAELEDSEAQANRAAEEEEACIQLEEQAAEAARAQQDAALREQEAHLAAAKNLIDLAKAQEVGGASKEKNKKVVQNAARGNDLSTLLCIPSQKTRDNIRKNEYIDLWHLTPAGMAAATKSRLSGNATYEFNTDGTFKTKECTVGLVADRDLDPTDWITALGNYVRVMRAEGVDADIVAAMIRLNHRLINDPLYSKHHAAIRLWHQEQRQQWVLSGQTSDDGERFNLGIPNEARFERIRMELLEERAERRLTGAAPSGSTSGFQSKRSAADDPPAPGPRLKSSRSNFRCFVCAATDSGHPFRDCAAKRRVDGKPQHVIRTAAGRLVFADNLKPVCINFQLRGCSSNCRANGNHRCANCGAGGHGASSCSA